MDRQDAQIFLENEVKGRYPGAEWTLPVDGDWIKQLSYLDEESALSAIRILRSKNNYKTPVLETFARLAKETTPNRSPTRTEYFIQYLGGGNTTLNAGYFFQIITTEEDHCKIAHDARDAREHSYGGEWKVITNTNWSTMIADRKVLSLQAKTGEMT